MSESTFPLRRLLPDPGEVDAAHAVDGIGFADLAPPDRPYIVLNMIMAADGHATFEGRSGGLAIDRADRTLFLALRDQVDAVLAGTGTLSAEGYRRLIRDPERRAAREARGLAADPLAVVLSRSGRIPDVPMLTDPDQPSAVYTGDDADPAAALHDLRARHGIRSLLCEGGPTLNAGLLAEGLVDELFLSVSPLLIGGPAKPAVEGWPLPEPARLDITSMLEHDGTLFLRYRIRPPSGSLPADG
ncbi:MAG: dihydrofolate reductase family protein [Solirubrobacteraceae bacterium]|nr:dihydrofolate reductase family protein [Solirubrobacteraceae bacterium]